MGDLLQFSGKHRLHILYDRFADELVAGSAEASQRRPLDSNRRVRAVVSRKEVSWRFHRSVTWVTRHLEHSHGWRAVKVPGWKCEGYDTAEIYRASVRRFLIEMARYAFYEQLDEDRLDRLDAECWLRGYEATQALFESDPGPLLMGLLWFPNWLSEYIVKDGSRHASLA